MFLILIQEGRMIQGTNISFGDDESNSLDLSGGGSTRMNHGLLDCTRGNVGKDI